MRLRELLGRPIAFQRCFVRLTDSMSAALMLSQALYWSERTSDPDGWFYKSREEWTEETGLSRRKQESARRALRESGCWQEKLCGVPARLFYRIDEDVLAKQLGINCPPSRAETGQQAGTKETSRVAQNEPTLLLTENTTESTTDISLETLRRVWDYYTQKLGKNPRLMTFTDLRRDKGMARLRECLEKTRGDVTKAGNLMRLAIDALAASKFHMGENERHTRYDSWEHHLFKSKEQLERWLDRT